VFRLKKDALVVVSPVPGGADLGIVLRRQTVPLTPHQTVFISVRNPSERVAQLSRGSLLARASLKERAADLEAAQSPGYRLQFLQHYLASRAGQENKYIQIDHNWVILGPDMAVKFGKNRRTNFK
jgi:hypothetical protein